MIACQIHAKIMACAWMAMGRSRANVHQDGQVIFYFRFVLNGEVYFKHNAPIYVFANICQHLPIQILSSSNRENVHGKNIAVLQRTMREWRNVRADHNRR